MSGGSGYVQGVGIHGHRTIDTKGNGRQASGTYPKGMLSCYECSHYNQVIHETSFTHTISVTVFVSSTFDPFNISDVCEQRHRTILNPF